MRMQCNRSWALLTTLAGCAALARTFAFAEQPPASTQRAPASDVQHADQGENLQTAYLIKLLLGSSQFRVRAQAAISLGLVERSPAAREALSAALRDEHPAVRAAAATSLGRIGEVKHLSTLHDLAGDPEEPVRNAARASIDRLESTIDEPSLYGETAATTAALSATTGAKRL